MKLSNGLKDALAQQILTNMRYGVPFGVSYSGYRIRFFDSSQMTTPYPLASQNELLSTYFAGNTPAGLILDFGFSIGIPISAFTVVGRSIKLLGTYTEAAKISGVADLAVIFTGSDYPSITNKSFSSIGTKYQILATDSVVPNGQQGAFVLTQTVMNAGDNVSIADFTLNIIEP